jgi:CTP:molybdopterin cytidylyltransferase MocA
MMAEDAITVEAAPQPVVHMRGADTKVVGTRSAGTSSMHRQSMAEARDRALVIPQKRMGHPMPQLRMGHRTPRQRTVVELLTVADQPMVAVVNTSNLNG